MPPYPEVGLRELADEIIACKLCPRLVSFRESVPARTAFKSEKYWRKPLPGFGDPQARLMLIGLAPAAHGGNRTGRLFTGDESARFLMTALHRVGLANQPTSLGRDDGLRLRGCYISAAVRCVPPANRPTPEEFINCSGYLDRELQLLTNLRAVVALGQLAFKAYLDIARKRERIPKGTKFAHGTHVKLEGLPWLYGCYHPSPRNTYTGKLTEAMLVRVLENARAEQLGRRPAPGAKPSGGRVSIRA